MIKQSLPILLLLLSLGCIFSASLVKREATEQAPSAKEILAMDGAIHMIKKKLSNAKSKLENVATIMERNIRNIIEMSEYISTNGQENIENALSKAKNVEHRMRNLRVELAQLASTTVSLSSRIIKKMQDISSGKTTWDKKGRSLLRSMNALLVTSERRLGEANEEIDKLTTEMNEVEAGLLIFESMIKAAIKKEGALSKTKIKDDVMKSINAIVSRGVQTAATWTNTDKKKSTTDRILQTVSGLLPAFTQLTHTVFDAINREDVLPMLESTLTDITNVIGIVHEQNEDIQTDRAIVTKWKGIIGDIRDEWGRTDDAFIEAVEDALEYDIDELVEGYTGLKNVAQEYMDHVKTVCPICL